MMLIPFLSLVYPQSRFKLKSHKKVQEIAKTIKRSVSCWVFLLAPLLASRSQRATGSGQQLYGTSR